MLDPLDESVMPVATDDVLISLVKDATMGSSTAILIFCVKSFRLNVAEPICNNESWKEEVSFLHESKHNAPLMPVIRTTIFKILYFMI